MARWLLRSTGFSKPVRSLAGPIMGRIMFRMAKDSSGVVNVSGHQMYLAPHKGYPPMNMLAGRYEPESSKLFECLATPGISVMDIGAHVGYYSLLAARRVGVEGRVYAFEPEPMNYGLLTKNMALNGYDNIKALNCAVSDRIGSNTLYLSALDNGRHTLFQQDMTHPDGETVELTTIDVFLESEGWPAVGLVKIDVEGGEWAVLEGMSQFFERTQKLDMIIEFNPVLLQSASVDPLEFLARPKEWGFDVHVIDEKTGPQPLDESVLPGLVSRLIAAESSVNLHYSRR